LWFFFAHSGALCCYFVLCIPCCLFRWIFLLWLPLQCSLTLNNLYEFSKKSNIKNVMFLSSQIVREALVIWRVQFYLIYYQVCSFSMVILTTCINAYRFASMLTTFTKLKDILVKIRNMIMYCPKQWRKLSTFIWFIWYMTM
jgi:hypothetical protein